MTSLLVKRQKSSSSSPVRSILGKKKTKIEPVDQKVDLNVVVETVSNGEQDQTVVTKNLDTIGTDLNNNCPIFERNIEPTEQEIDEAIMSMVTPVTTTGSDLTSDQNKNELVPRRLSFEETKDESEREEEDVIGDEESNESNQTRIGLFSRESN